jgi:hypothetical protein
VPLPTPQRNSEPDIKTSIRETLSLHKTNSKGKIIELEIALIQKINEGSGMQ